MAQKTGIQVVTSAFPMDVHIENKFQKNLPVLYIVDNENASALAQTIEIKIAQNNTKAYTLKGFGFTSPDKPTPAVAASTETLCPSNSSFTPDADQFNLAIGVRPGTLRKEVVQNFTNTLQKAITESFTNENGVCSNPCVVQGPITRKSDGELIWYVAFANDIQSSGDGTTVSVDVSSNSWNKGIQTLKVKDVAVTEGGELIAISTEGSIYNKASLEAQEWTRLDVLTSVGNPWVAQGIAIAPGLDWGLLGMQGQPHWVSGNILSGNISSPLMTGGPVSNLALQKDGTALGVNGSHELVTTPKGGTTWTPVPDPVKIMAVASAGDGSLVAAGTDNKLYRRTSIDSTASWVLDESISQPICGVAFDQNGNLMVIGTDNVLYTTEQNWVATPFQDKELNSIQIIGATVHPTTGAITVIDTNGAFYTKPSLQGGTWQSISPLSSLSLQGKGISVGGDGNYVFVGSNNSVYKGTRSPGDTPTSASMGNTISALLPTGKIVLIQSDNEILYAAGGSYTSSPDPVKVLSIAMMADGSFVGAGTDKRLYWRKGVEQQYAWQLVPSMTTPIISVGNDANGHILLVGADHLLYRLGEVREVKEILQGNTISVELQDAVINAQGEVVAVGTDNLLYKLPTLSGSLWQSIETPISNCVGIGFNSSGDFLFADQSGSVYKGGTTASDSATSQNISGDVKSISSLSDGTLVGVNLNNELVQCASGKSSWTPVQETINILSVAVKSDNSLVAAGSDNRLYTRTSISSGPWQPGQELPIPIIGVLYDPSDGLFVIGTDHTLYQPQKNAVATPYNDDLLGSMEIISATVHPKTGAITVIDTDGKFYTKTSISNGTWAPISPLSSLSISGRAISVAYDGDYVFVGSDNNVYKGTDNPATAPTSASMGVTISALLMANKTVLVDTSREIMHSKSSGGYTYESNLVKVQSIAVRADGTFVGAGTDNKLYWRKDVEQKYSWQLIPSVTTPIISVGNDAEGNIIMVGSDNKLYHITETEVAIEIAGEVQIKDLSISQSGEVLGVSENGGIYTKASFKTPHWEKLNTDWQSDAIAANPAGGYFVLESSGKVYNASVGLANGPRAVTLGSAITISNTVTNISVLSDGTFVGVNASNQLVQCPKAGGAWTVVTDPTTILNVAVKADDSLVAAGTDNKLYARKSINSGQWEEVLTDVEAICGVAVDQNDDLVLIGKDYSLTKILTPLKTTAQSCVYTNPISIKDFVVADSGELVGISVTGGIYRKASASSGSWKKVDVLTSGGSSWVAQDVCRRPDGSYALLGPDGNPHTITGNTLLGTISNYSISGDKAISISTLPDGSFLGVNSSHQPMHCPLNGHSWTTLNNPGGVLSIASFSDGSLVCAGTDNKLYTRSSIANDANWVLYAGFTQEIVGVSVDPQDRLWVLGTDHVVYSTEVCPTTAVVDNQPLNALAIKDMVVDPSSGLVAALDTNNLLFTKTSLQSGIWQAVNPGGPWLSVNLSPDGNYVFTGTDNLGNCGANSPKVGPLPIANKKPILNLAVMPDGSYVAVNTSNELVHCATTATSWTPITDPVKILAITVRPDGTLVAAGTDNKLYERAGIATGDLWQPVAGIDIPISNVANDAEGNLLVIGTDHKAYEAYPKLISSPVSNEEFNSLTIIDLTVDPSSGLVTALDSNNLLHTKPSLETGNWTALNPGDPWSAVSYGSDGKYYFVGTDNIVNVGHSDLQSNPGQASNKNPVISMTVMSDGSYIAIDKDNELVHCVATATSWTPITDATKVLALTVRPDGSLAAAGTDNKLYQRAGITDSNSWQEVKDVDLSITNVANDAKGNLLVIGTDQKVYTIYDDLVLPFDDEVLNAMEVISATVHPTTGAVTVIDKDHNFHTKASWQSSTWESISPLSSLSLKGISISVAGDGSYVFVGSDNCVYKGTANPGDTPTSASMGQTISALLPTNTIILITISNEILYALPDESYTNTSDPVKVTSIAAKTDGTFVGAGTDNRLYWRKGVEQEYAWQLILSMTTPIISVGNDADGNILLIGTDHKVYSYKQSLTVETINNEPPIKDLLIADDGSITAVGSDNKLYAKTSLTAGNWQLLKTASGYLSIAFWPAQKKYLFVNSAHEVLIGNSPEASASNEGEAVQLQSITISANNVWFGVNIDNELVLNTWGTNSWNVIQDAVKIQNMAVKPDGTLLAAGVDNKLYTRGGADDTYTWQEVPSVTTPIIGVASDANNTTYVIGADHAIYSLELAGGSTTTALTTDAIDAVIVDAVMSKSGALVGVDPYNNILQKPSINTGTWNRIDVKDLQGHSMLVNSVGLDPDEQFVVVDSSGVPYQAGKQPTDILSKVSLTGSANNISVLSDSSFIGVNDDNQLVHCLYDTPNWVVVDDTTKIISVAAKSDGSLVAAGLDNKVYTRPGIDSGTWKEDASIAIPVCGVLVDPGHNDQLVLIGTDNELYEQPTKTTTKDEQQYEFMSFTIEKISAAAGTGPRSAMVELLFGNVLLNNTGKALSFAIEEQINIVNPENSSSLPLFFGALEDGELLNQAEIPGQLSLYFQTLNGKAIQFSDDADVPSEIEFSFRYATEQSGLLNFGTAEQVSAYTLSTTPNYPFEIEGKTISKNGVAVTGKDDGKGRVSFKAVFSNLGTVYSDLTINTSSQIEASKNLYGLGNSSVQSAITTKQTDCATELSTLLSFFKTNGLGSLNAMQSLGQSENHEAMCCGTIDTDNGTSAPCGFDFLLWTVLYKANLQYGHQSKLPAGINSQYSATSPWSDLDFLLFTIRNYSTLTTQITNELGSALEIYAASTGYDVSALRPGEGLYAYFRSAYEKSTTIDSVLSDIGLSNIGPQTAAQIGIYTDLQGIKRKAYAKCQELAAFLTSEEGPYQKLATTLNTASIKNYVSDSSLAGASDLLTINICNYSGNAPTMPGYQNFKKFSGKISSSNWDVLPEGMVSEYNSSSLWNNSQFTTYFSNQICTIAATLLAFNENALLHTDKLGVYQLVPCKAVFEFVKTLFELEQTLAAYSPTFLLDVSTAFTADAWNNALDDAKAIVPNGRHILDQSAIGSTSQSFEDTDFVTYLKTNIKTLCAAVGTYDYTPPGASSASSYMLPSQSLYDYLWMTFLKNNPDKIPSPPPDSSLMQAANYIFNFSEILTSGDNGQVMLEIVARNFPGYRDTHFQVPILKYDTTTNSTVKLGRSVTPGRTFINPKDLNYTNDNWPSYGSRVDFLTGGSQNGQATVSIEEHYGLNLFGSSPDKEHELTAQGLPATKGDFSQTGQPVRVRQADLLVETGRLGIGNVPNGMLSGDFTNPTGISTTELDQKLRVEGDSHLNGKASITDDLTVGGNVTVDGDIGVQGHLNVDGETGIAGDLTVGGVISDQFGRLIPVGTISILSYGNGVTPTDPDGWLICDGRNLTTLLLDDLTQGIKTDPDYVSKYWDLFLFLGQNMHLAEVWGWSGSTTPLNNEVVIRYSTEEEGFYFYGTEGQPGQYLNDGALPIKGNYNVYLPKFSASSAATAAHNTTSYPTTLKNQMVFIIKF